MGYVLGQYIKTAADDPILMTLMTSGSAKRRDTQVDAGVQNTGINFQNECLQIGGSFNNNNNYYFHGKIKRMNSNQVFSVKLVNYSSSEMEQYIKKITIGGGDPHEWVDIEFVFNPYATFDTILFELQRTAEDYSDEVRYPIFIYEEVSVINNLISRRIGNDIELLKIGVQSKPGLLMCINGEEIRTSRSGIYELKDDVIVVSFFSALAAATETTSSLDEAISMINTQWDIADAYPTPVQRAQAKASIGSRALLESSKTRTIENFVLDYLYKED